MFNKLNINQKKGLYIFIFAILSLFIFRLVLLGNLNKLYYDNFETLILDKTINNQKLGYKRNKKSVVHNHKYEFNISKNQLKKNNKLNSIVIYKLTGTYYEVFWNDQLIGENGNFNKNNSNITHDLKSFIVPKNFVFDNNSLKIVSYNIHESGLQGYPIIITSNTTAQKIESIIKIGVEGFIGIGAGFLIATFLIFCTIFVLDDKNKKVYLFLAIASFFTLIILGDYIYFPFLPMKVLNFKKIIYTSYYLAIGFFTMAFSFLFKNKKLRYVAYFTFLIPFILLTIDLMEKLKELHHVFLISVLLNIILWIYYSLKEIKNKKYTHFIFIGSVILLLTAAYDVLALNVTYYFIPFFIIGLIAFVFSLYSIILKEYNYMNIQRGYHKNEAEKFYQLSIRDQLTNVYNRTYLNEFVKKLENDYCLMVIDIDNFKKINDTYGHPTGDLVLKRVSSVINKNILNNDVLIRYGGDEFVVIFRNKKLDSVYEVGKKIIDYLSKKEKYYDFYFSVNLSIGIYHNNEYKTYDQVLKKADELLYKAKESSNKKIYYR